ncbi:MAG TPA: hypothetical protein VH062_23000 [Polyangiaceae bacterium]|jgi:hypothetical protein|nr:hypothetical protein [Polyangiaceae bacterium]
MKKFLGSFLVCACAIAPFVACSSDKGSSGSDGGTGGSESGGSKNDNDASTGGSGAKGGAGGSSGKGGASGSGAMAGTAGTTTDGGDASTTTTDGGGEGGTTGPLPQAVLCPEANPFSPKNANSVSIDEVVTTKDEHWTADKVYLIGDDFTVQNATLTVDAGTVICLYQSGKIHVGAGIDPGEIHLNGTADKPIVITTTPSNGDQAQPDVFHGGIQFDTYMASTVSYVNIWYGGPGGGGASWALELTDTAEGTDKAKPLLLDHVTVGEVQTKGVRIGTKLGVADGSSIRFTGFVTPNSQTPALDAVAEVDIRAAKSFNEAFDYSGAFIPAGAKHVNLDANADESLDSDAEVTSIGLPYLYKNAQYLEIAGAQDGPGVTLTIDEGVTIEMSGALIVGTLSGTAQGDLVIAGSAAKPVVLTSSQDTPAAGDWEGIYFVGGQYDPTKSKIDHAQILYAGVDTSDPLQVAHHIGRCSTNTITTAAIMITSSSSSAPYPGPSITNTFIAHSASDGIASDASNSGGQLSNDYSKATITFSDIANENLEIGACK